jgi:hypothetical protein
MKACWLNPEAGLRTGSDHTTTETWVASRAGEPQARWVLVGVDVLVDMLLAGFALWGCWPCWGVRLAH